MNSLYKIEKWDEVSIEVLIVSQKDELESFEDHVASLTSCNDQQSEGSDQEVVL